MTRLLLAERAPANARVLVVGAGGGLELKIRRRLKPGAPLVVAHHSFPQGEADRALWLSRYVSFAISTGVDPVSASNARSAIAAQLPILSPEQDEAILREGGFTDVSLFYAGFTFRGWVAYAPVS